MHDHKQSCKLSTTKFTIRVKSFQLSVPSSDVYYYIYLEDIIFSLAVTIIFWKKLIRQNTGTFLISMKLFVG